MSRRLRKPQVSDWHLWSDVARTVKPLEGRPSPLSMEIAREKDPLPPRPGPRFAPPPGHIKTHGAYQPQPRPAPPPVDKRLEPRLHRRLMRGQVTIDATLDLHGMRQHEAEVALHRFIHRAWARGERSLLVITGKGIKKSVEGQIEQRGVLRHMLPHWLRQKDLTPMIAGWEVSAHGHGGEGAYYVRLKGGRP